jgi:hypothetical protein
MASVNPSTLPFVTTIGGQVFTTSCFSIPVPPPDPGPDPGTGGGDTGGGDTGGGGTGGVPGPAGFDVFGVKKIFPDYPNPEFPPFYMDMDNKANNTRYNISYGTGSHIAYTSKTEGNLKFYNSAGAVQNYASGNPSSRSVRNDVYPSGGIWGNSTNYSYRSNPGYLYKLNHFHNKEMTIYIRPHGQLKTHESVAFKMQGRDQDEIRSCVEFCYPTATLSQPALNVEYMHFPYVGYKNVRIYNTSSTKQKDGQWLGLKCVLIIADNKKSAWLGLFEDITPFTSAGKPANNWKLRADTVFTGVSDSDYDNKIPTWDPQKDVVRLDGFQNQDIMWYSDRPISKGIFKDPQAVTPAGGWVYGTPQVNPSQYEDPNI